MRASRASKKGATATRLRQFMWPQVKDGTVALSAAQLSMLLEGIDWRRPKRTTPAPQDPDRTHPTLA